MAIKVQLALQGGGAKILCLIAALKAVEELQNKKVIQVTRIAGTSAGAIAGALFAVGIPMDDVLQWFAKPEQKELGDRLQIRYSDIPKIMTGEPVFDPKLLKKIIKDLFKLGGIRPESTDLSSFEDDTRKIPIIVTYTDLESSKVLKHNSDTKLLDALMNSAALPFILRTYKSPNARRVDGGIGENCPSNFLLPGEGEHVAAITFSQDMREIDSLLKYSTALLFTAMDHSVNRSLKSLGKEAICRLETDIDTIEFNKILGKENSQEIDKSHKTAKTFFEGFASRCRNREKLYGDPWLETKKVENYWSRKYNDLMNSLGQVYLAQKQIQKVPIKTIRLEIYVGSHSRSTCGHDREEIIYRRRFDVNGEAIYFTSISLDAPSLAEIDEINYLIRGPNSHLLDIIPTPILIPREQVRATSPDDIEQDIQRQMLLWLQNPLQPQTENYELFYQTIGQKLLSKLHQDKKEWILITTNNSSETVPLIDIFIVLPESTMNSAELLTLSEDNDYPPYFGLGYVCESPGEVKKLTHDEAKEFFKSQKTKLAKRLPQGCGVLHWSAKDVPPNETVGAQLTLS